MSASMLAPFSLIGFVLNPSTLTWLLILSQIIDRPASVMELLLRSSVVTLSFFARPLLSMIAPASPSSQASIVADYFTHWRY